jgi:hypothetical protein
MGCLYSTYRTNRVIVLVSKDKSWVEFLSLRRRNDYRGSGEYDNIYSLCNFIKIFGSGGGGLDFTRENRVYNGQYSFSELDKRVVESIHNTLIINTETFNTDEVIGREELIYVYNWMNTIKDKYKDNMDDFSFVYMQSYFGTYFNYTINIKELKQSVKENPFKNNVNKI